MLGVKIDQLRETSHLVPPIKLACCGRMINSLPTISCITLEGIMIHIPYILNIKPLSKLEMGLTLTLTF